MMCGIMRSLWVSLMVGALALNALGKTFSAHVDKTAISSGGSIRLTLEFDGQTNDEPELATLEKEFSILSRQTAQESSFVNGNHLAKTSWILEILPKSSAKSLVIPSIKLGQLSSAPISIAQTEQAEQVGHGGIAVTMSTDRRETYINAEVILSVTIKTPMTLRNASLTKPEIKNAIVEPLVEGEKSETVEQGIKYSTYRQSYAVYPNKAGELSIPPVIFRGIGVADRQSGTGLRGLFSNGSSVSMRSNGVTIHVKDVPAEFPKGKQFLALKSFVVIEAFDEANPVFEVNKATTRRFEMKAKGGLASFLPTINTPSVKDLQVYSESGNKMQKSEHDGMLSSTKFAHIYMPMATGRVSVPEQDIYWWNVDEDKLKVTTIRALDLDVVGNGAPAHVASPNETEPAPVVENAPVAPKIEPVELQPVPAKNYIWQMVSAALFIAWLGTLAYFMWRRRGEQLPSKKAPEKSLELELKERLAKVEATCGTKDAKAVYQSLGSLLMWTERHRLFTTNYEELVALKNKLERTLYDRETASSSDVIDRIKRDLHKTRPRTPAVVAVAPLYPQ